MIDSLISASKEYVCLIRICKDCFTYETQFRMICMITLCKNQVTYNNAAKFQNGCFHYIANEECPFVFSQEDFKNVENYKRYRREYVADCSVLDTCISMKDAAAFDSSLNIYHLLSHEYKNKFSLFMPSVHNGMIGYHPNRFIRCFWMCNNCFYYKKDVLIPPPLKKK